MNHPNAQQHTDQELIHRFRADGRSDWIGILFDRYALLLLGLCMKYLKNEEDARDSVQQIFLKVLQEINKHEIVFFKAWIYQVTKNHCLMILRRQQKFHQAELTDSNVPATTMQEQHPQSQHQQKDQMLQNMEHALEQLNEEQQTSVRLFYLEKKSYQEIVDMTGYTLLQVKSYIQNGKRNLKILLEKINQSNG
ncbi:RNA polymerase subunit sigma-24 [Chitinophaga caeni]|uniref:RNA polymerase subunit sigma-24 n=1 Tax=Chitinophaga caeni TaxID=2029983 RepID=A0A291QXB5_9BACT|nr:sigma-70 family RNA polymerase sigma factor [Chitinophaga caeni]ATL48522.1 RNA polymerase subunit sigma-24 [Chitinophaga caeni]